MKLLAVTPLYPPSSRVGSWLSTHECLAHMVRRGHQVEVVRQLGTPRPAYLLDGVKVWAGAGRIEPTVAESDVVISHLGDTGRASRAAADAGKPNVRMAHGGGATPEKLEGSALVVWNSDSYRDGRRGIVVHPPVLPERYRTVPGDMVTLVNLSEDKGVKTFWRCAEQLPDVKFLGVQGGTGRQVIPRAENVETVRTVGDMRTVYSRTRVLLMPSVAETWGRVAVEAICSGIPVIAHPTPGLREALGRSGIYVDRDDIDGWARMVSRLVGRRSSWDVASKLASKRSAELTPLTDMDRFAEAVEALT